MRKVIASLMLMASIPCQASWDDWSDSDKAWGATALAITAVDMLQTVDISKHPNQFHETNPILGKHPSTAQVYGYFLASAAAGYLVMDSLPSPWRKVFAGGVILMEANVVTRNYQLGIKLSF